MRIGVYCDLYPFIQQASTAAPPATLGFIAFFPTEWRSLFFRATGAFSCPPPFWPLNGSLELLPSSALFCPDQVGSVSTKPFVRSTENQRTAITLNFVSRTWGSPQGGGSLPCCHLSGFLAPWLAEQRGTVQA